MAEIICIIGNKGGTGKTTLSHLLCHGLTLLGRRAACVMTDEDREPLSPAGRNYLIADARSPIARDKMVGKLRELSGWIGVLDGGANRTDTDIALYQMSDVVLLPFRDSAEDMRTVIRDLDLLPKAWALPSQWSRNKRQQEAALEMIEAFPFDFRQRVLPPVYALSATKSLLQHTLPEDLPGPLNNAARQFARRILGLFEDEPEEVLDALTQVRDTAEAEAEAAH